MINNKFKELYKEYENNSTYDNAVKLLCEMISISDSYEEQAICDLECSKLLDFSEYYKYNKDGYIYPCFTVNEMLDLGFINEDDINTSSWLEDLYRTNDPGADYRDRLLETYSTYDKDKSEENKNKLLKLGWDPAIYPTNENIKQVSESYLKRILNSYIEILNASIIY